MAVPNYGALGLVNPLEVFAQSQKVQDTLTARGDALKKLQNEQLKGETDIAQAEANQRSQQELVRLSNLKPTNNINGIGAVSEPPPVVPPTQAVVAKPTPKRLPLENATNFILNSGTIDPKNTISNIDW